MQEMSALQQAFEHAPEVVLAVLFGSAARDRTRPRSDLDVGVLFVDDLDSTSQLTVELERATGRTVDLVRLDQAPALLRFEIARNGQAIVERRPHAWSDFRARAMVDWWDWAPTARMLHEAAVARLRQRVKSGAQHGPA